MHGKKGASFSQDVGSAGFPVYFQRSARLLARSPPETKPACFTVIRVKRSKK
jgi:hypothetical protein